MRGGGAQPRPPSPAAMGSAFVSPTREEAPFVKNKFAQLVVAVIARDYPQMWPHAFTQLLDVLQCGPGSIDMFLRVLNAVHEEVICSDGGGYNPHLASKIKDAMREQCLPQITDAWFSILQLHESAPGLVVSCLNTMHLYVNWMDIALLSHPRFVGLLLPFMRQPQLHDGACLCLGEIVLKRMEAPAKLQHIERLELVGADLLSMRITFTTAKIASPRRPRAGRRASRRRPRTTAAPTRRPRRDRAAGARHRVRWSLELRRGVWRRVGSCKSAQNGRRHARRAVRGRQRVGRWEGRPGRPERSFPPPSVQSANR